MREEGVVVPGAVPGRKGSGCFKLSAEEKARRGDVAKSASRKLKGAGKVTQKWYHTVCVYCIFKTVLAGHFQSS